MSIYGDRISQLETVVSKGNTLIQNIIKNETVKNGISPIEYYKSRIKDESSLIDKLKRKGFPVTMESVYTNIHDLVGFRIVCTYISGVQQVAKAIISNENIELIESKDYIKHPKCNGYRSLHLIVKFKDSDVTFEIQLRTIAMDSWASLEHQMKYKKEIKHKDLIVAELKRCADEMSSTDLTMQAIYDLIKEEN
ncbi:MAG: GTP pyrophosphokinase family protein [Sphaerochaetaceae bacterium]